MNNHQKAIIAGIIGNSIFGFSFLFSKIALTSIISVLAGVVVLHEKVSPVQVIAIVLILFGVYKVNQKN